MTEQQTISWIFLATAMASQIHPTDFNGISNIADGINHAVPTHNEIQLSITWLLTKGLVTKNEKKYELTVLGKIEFEKAKESTNILLRISENIEIQLKNYA